MQYVIRDNKVIQMQSAVGCIAFEGTQSECENFVAKNGSIYEPRKCPLCGLPSKSGAWFAHDNGSIMVCFDCRSKPIT